MPYLSLTELAEADSARALARFSDEQKLEAIRQASSEADAYLSKVIATPIGDAYVSDVLQLQILRMTKYLLFSENGFSLQGDDQIIRDNYDLARKFFQDIAAGKAILGPGMLPPVVVDPATDLGPFTGSEEDRGYGGSRV